MANSRFFAQVSTAALLLAAVPAQDKPVDAAARRATVRAVLHSICASEPSVHDHTINLAALQLTTARRGAGGEVTLIQPLRCGLGDDARTRLDRRRAAEQVKKLAREYGVSLRSDVRVTLGNTAVQLPLADAGRKLAFAWHTTELGSREPDLLDQAAVAQLRGRGWVVHHADLEDFRAQQSDTLSPLLAYAVSTVAFLEREAGGVGFDLGCFLGAATALPLTREGFTCEGATELARSDASVDFTVAARGALRLRFAGVPRAAGRKRTLVVLGCYRMLPFRAGRHDASGPRPAFTLVQGGLRVESRRGVFLMPAAFAPGQPFEVHGTLPPGRYTLASVLQVRAAAGGR